MTIKRFNTLIWVVLILIFSNNCKKDNAIYDCNNYPIPVDTYKYPILPGTPEWAALHTTEAKWQACQIPDSLLPTMTTEGLVESWLNMPLNNEIQLTNSLQKAMEWFIGNFSGLKELVGRTDAAEKLFKRYQSLNPACITSLKTDLEQGAFTFSFLYIELPLAQDTILNKLTLADKKALIIEAMEKYNSRIEYASYYDVVGRDLSLFISARVMKNCMYQPFLDEVNYNLLRFIENAQFSIPLGDYTTEKNIIIVNALNFIK